MTERELRSFVLQRSKERWEYCRVPLTVGSLPWQIDHVVAMKHGGRSVDQNLAAACLNCNANKQADLSGIDPVTGELTRLFNPRNDTWDEHFIEVLNEIVGLTPIGRVTVYVLAMNDDEVLTARAAAHRLSP